MGAIIVVGIWIFSVIYVLRAAYKKVQSILRDEPTRQQPNSSRSRTEIIESPALSGSTLVYDSGGAAFELARFVLTAQDFYWRGLAQPGKQSLWIQTYEFFVRQLSVLQEQNVQFQSAPASTGVISTVEEHLAEFKYDRFKSIDHHKAEEIKLLVQHRDCLISTCRKLRDLCRNPNKETVTNYLLTLTDGAELMLTFVENSQQG